MKWNKSRRNFKVGDTVLLKDDHSPNQWPMTSAVQTELD